MPLRAIIFDFDGVIANSEPLHYLAFRDVLTDAGVALSEEDYYARYLGYDDLGAFRAIAHDRKRPWSADDVTGFIARKADRMEALERERSVLFPGAATAVRQASAAVPIAIASGALGPEIRRVLEREGLTPCFTAIVAAGDTPFSKPQPDPYLRAVELLSEHVAHAAPALDHHDCVAIEDSVWGLESARRAGLRTIGVAQTYPAETLHADLVIETIAHFDLRLLHDLCAS